MTIITNIEMGRKLTPDEVISRDAYINEQLAAETTNGQTAGVYNSTFGIRVWNSEEAANAWVTWCNTNFDPAPVSAVVQTI